MNGVRVVATALCCLEPAAAMDKTFAIPRLDEAPLIDGVVGPREWVQAARRSDLLQASPIEFAPPTQETVWYFGYDETTLYVAGIAHDDDPGAIVARVLRQGGSLASDDSLNILVDGANNKRSGYLFALNPNGVRADAIFTNGVDRSDEWDGIWHGAASRTETGWSVEMAIPFNTLSFDASRDTWGFNFWRENRRANETMAWRSVAGEVNPTGSGEMAGLRDLDQGLGLDIVPAASATTARTRGDGATRSELKPSLDLRYRFTPSVNGVLTINTDFAATEVDDRQLGLDRFGVFFPEKRAFFLTDFDIFQFGGISEGGPFAPIGYNAGPNAMPFFSRRIGLGADKRPIDIIAGGKLSGRAGGLDFGALLVRQDRSGDVGARDLAVARITHSILEESSIGAIATSGDPTSNGDNELVGIDFSYRNTRLGNGRTLQGHAWWQKSDDGVATGEDDALSVTVGLKAEEGLSVGAQYQEVRENFLPALGFVERVGVRLYSLESEYIGKYRDNGILQEYEFQAGVMRWEYLDTGIVQSEEIEIAPLKLTTTAGDVLRLQFRRHTESLLPGEQPLERIGVTLSPGTYRFDRPGIVMRSARHRRLSFAVRASFGDFYAGTRSEVRPEIRWAPSMHFYTAMSLGLNRFRFSGYKRTTRQLNWNTEIAFDAAWSLLTNVQYDNLSNDLGINARLRYNIAAGRDFWLVLNHDMHKRDVDERFHSERTAAVVKLRYTFRF